jgi:hypothetical protein
VTIPDDTSQIRTRGGTAQRPLTAWVIGMSHWRVIRTLWNKGKAGGLADILSKEPRNDATECFNNVTILG